MSPEHQRKNIESWKFVADGIEEYPDTEIWVAWKSLVRNFLRKGIDAGLNRHFRAGQSMHDIIFSTLDHHGLRDEPRVTVRFHPPLELWTAYGARNISFNARELEYLLPFDEGFATFHRFLYQLWTATMAEPIPEDIRTPAAPLLAPVLSPANPEGHE